MRRTMFAGSVLLLTLGHAACTSRIPICSDADRERISDFATALETAIEASSRLYFDEEIDLPKVTAERRIKDTPGVPVILDRSGMRLLGSDHLEDLHTTTALADEAAALRALHDARGRSEPIVLSALIAGDVPASDVSALLRLAVAAEIDQVEFFADLADAPPIPAIPLMEIQSQVRARTGGEAQATMKLVGELVETEAERCPTLRFSMGHARLGPGEYPIALARVMELALYECGCQVNLDRTLSLLHVVVAPSRITAVSPTMKLSAEGELRVSPKTPWSAVAQAAFEKDRKSFWLEASDPLLKME